MGAWLWRLGDGGLDLGLSGLVDLMVSFRVRMAAFSFALASRVFNHGLSPRSSRRSLLCAWKRVGVGFDMEG